MHLDREGLHGRRVAVRRPVRHAVPADRGREAGRGQAQGKGGGEGFRQACCSTTHCSQMQRVCGERRLARISARRSPTRRDRRLHGQTAESHNHEDTVQKHQFMMRALDSCAAQPLPLSRPYRLDLRRPLPPVTPSVASSLSASCPPAPSSLMSHQTKHREREAIRKDYSSRFLNWRDRRLRPVRDVNDSVGHPTAPDGCQVPLAATMPPPAAGGGVAAHLSKAVKFPSTQTA